jgi:hypothetical protein
MSGIARAFQRGEGKAGPADRGRRIAASAKETGPSEIAVGVALRLSGDRDGGHGAHRECGPKPGEGRSGAASEPPGATGVLKQRHLLASSSGA